jgi:hypothetical protein
MNLSATVLLNKQDLEDSCFSDLDKVFEFIISLHKENHGILIGFVLLSAVLSVVTCLGNTVVLLAYIRSPQLCKKLSSIFVINLAVADWLIGVIVHPLLMIFFVQTINNDSSCVFISLLLVVIPIFIMVSLFSVVGATAERFLAIVFPLYHRTELTKTKLRMFVLLSWVYAISWISILFLSKKNLKLYVTLNGVLPIIMTTFVIILWFYIFIAIKGQSTTIRNISCGSHRGTIAQYRQRSERKTAKAFLMATLNLYVSSSPLLIALFSGLNDPVHIICLLEIMLLSSVINPIIYGLGNNAVRNAVRMELFC